MSLESRGRPSPKGSGPSPKGSGPSAKGSGPSPKGSGPAAKGSGPASGQRWRILDDPVVIRALAHPLRNELLAIVGRLGSATTAETARELGISHGLASHHLAQLAKYGFVEQVAGKDRRERPWRLVATSYSWSGATSTPEGSAAVDAVEQVQAEKALEGLVDWQQRRRAWPGTWRQHAGIGTSTIYLTEEELAQVSTSIYALLRRYVEERPLDDVASRPPGSAAVGFTVFAIPAGRVPPE
ncbi:MAG TPA: helix-turn-helix domain-containing protein [Acidimicrobiales bacterium]|nr:helix-turn-helix domain-containing protein [Acidimicrobiales bacterium]